MKTILGLNQHVSLLCLDVQQILYAPSSYSTFCVELCIENLQQPNKTLSVYVWISTACGYVTTWQ